jgi:hypothetical protein
MGPDAGGSIIIRLPRWSCECASPACFPSFS